MTKAQAIEHYGSMKALAKALGVSYEAVRQWESVPPLRQYELERITEGALKVESTEKTAA